MTKKIDKFLRHWIICEDNTSKDPFSQCEQNYKELQEIHIQVKSEYVDTLTMTEMMTRMRRTESTTTCYEACEHARVHQLKTHECPLFVRL